MSNIEKNDPAKIRYNQQNHSLSNQKLTVSNNKIKLFIYDFYGVMTNNKVLVDQYGHESVLINRADGLADEEIKKLVSDLKIDQRPEYRTHRKVHRPWGNYEILDSGKGFQVKKLSVNHGASLSLQVHGHSAAHWVVVSGIARVTIGEDQFLLKENESTYVQIGVKHRLENASSKFLEIIEVQSGDYLGEDDIKRYEDRYNR